MPTFDMVCVGTGGGPDETNLSAYLLKPSQSSWQDGIIALEAGSGQGALNQILKRQPDLFASSSDSAIYSPADIYSFVRCYLITHAHLDHVNSLVISAGSLKGSRKRVYAAEETLKDLESVFADRLWPNLASWNEEDEAYKLLYTTLSPNSLYTPIFPDVSVRIVPLNHGLNGAGTYESSAFFIRHDPSSSEFLFFGDVEPDAIAHIPRNIDIWRIAAPMIVNGTLATIFIECSWPSGRPDEQLYGHLSPEHLVTELEALASEVAKVHENDNQTVTTTTTTTTTPRSQPARKKRKKTPTPSTRNRTPSTTPAFSMATDSSISQKLRGALDGLRVYVMHCKDTMDCAPDKPIGRLIVEEVRALVLGKGLGAEVFGAEQGMRIEI